MFWSMWVVSALGCGAAPVAGEDATAPIDVADGSKGPVDAPEEPVDAPEESVDAALDAPDDAGEDATRDVGASWEGGHVTGERADRPLACPAGSPIADTFDWAPPRVQTNACSETEIEAIGALFVGGVPAVPTLRRSVSARCFACAYSGIDEATWGALYLSRDLPPYWRANEGGCLVAAGVSEACGRAYNNFQHCAWAACDGCPVSRLTTCYNNRALYERGGACDGYLNEYRRVCRMITPSYEACINESEFELSDISRRILRVMCGPEALPAP